MRRTPVVLWSLVLLAAGCTDDTEGEIHCDEDGHCVNEADESEGFSKAFEEGLVPADLKADTYDCSGVRLPDRSGFNKRIALTFDDGPHAVNTPQIIDVLHAHNAPATFFINGSKLNTAGKAIARRIAEDPSFILANHSQNHADLSKLVGTQGIAAVATEMDRTDAGIRLAGEAPKYFRFPFGASNCATKKLAESRGWFVTGWTVDSADWCYGAGGGYCKKETFEFVPDAMRGDMLAYIKSQLQTNNGGVVLMHDIQANTAQRLDSILTALEQDGYTFVRLDDTSAFPKLNKVATPFIGDRCTTDAECAFTANGQAGRCHSAGFCTISCAGSCPDLAGRTSTFCIQDASGSSGGTCVSKATTQNNNCESLPGTSMTQRPRFDPLALTAVRMNVCAPR